MPYGYFGGATGQDGESVTVSNAYEVIYYNGDANTDGSQRDLSDPAARKIYFQQRIDGDWETISERGGSLATDAIYLWDKSLIQAQDRHVSGKERDMIGWNRALDVVFVGDSAEDVDVDIIGTPFSSKMAPNYPFAWDVRQGDSSVQVTATDTSFLVQSQTYPDYHIGVLIEARLPLASVPADTRMRFLIREGSDINAPVVYESASRVNWARGAGNTVVDGLNTIPLHPPFPSKSDTTYFVTCEFSEEVVIEGNSGGVPYHELHYGLNNRSELISASRLAIQYVEADAQIYHSGEHAVDTTFSTVTLTVDDVDALGELDRIVIFDTAGTFNQNSCFLEIGTNTYEMDKKNKQYDFWKADGSWHWSEMGRKVK